MSNRRPTPRFQPRRSRAALRGGRRRWLPAAITAAVAVLLIGGAVAWIVVANIDDDDGGGGTTAAGGPEPVLEGPASRYVVQLTEVPNGWDILPPATYPLTATGFATNGYFRVRQDGEDKAATWGYEDGYQSSFEPLGKQADLLRGGYYFQTEAYLFKTVEGAAQAYAYIEEQHRSQPASDSEQAPDIGNEASAFKTISGTVGTSDVPAVYYRVVFRRGNLVVVVQTNGAEPSLTIDRAAQIAAGIDDKALGRRDSPTPTPAPKTPGLTAPTPTAGP